jgi:hypothetical protein
MPPGDLSLLQAIAPIGNKFHSPADVGPMSNPNTVATGSYAGTFWLHFSGPVTPPTPPRITKVEAATPGRVTVTFDRLMSTDAFIPSRYTFSPVRKVHAVTAGAANSVALDVEPLAEGADYNLTVGSVTSIDGLPLAGQTVFPVSYNRGLSIRLPFDAASGNVSSDTSGNNSNATLSNSTLAKGYAGSAATFTGTVGSSASITLPSLTQLTVAAWVRPLSAGNSSFPRILSFVNDGVQFLFDFTGGTPETIGFQAAGKGSWRGAGTALPALGTWMHVAVSYDASSASAPTFYLNGAALSTVSAAGGTGTFTTAGVATIGNRASDGLRGFDGSIDQLLIYNRVLSPAEIGGLAALPATHTYAQWLASAGLADGGATQDSDRDGLPDFLEYLFASNPNQSSVSPTAVDLEGANQEFFFPVSQDAEGVNVTVESSPNLSDWTSVPASDVSPWRVSAGFTEYRAVVPAGSSSQFFRLRLDAR